MPSKILFFLKIFYVILILNELAFEWLYRRLEILYDLNMVSRPKLIQVIAKIHYDKRWVKASSSLYIPSSLSAREQNLGERFLHVFLQNERAVARLGCSGAHVLTTAALQNIRNDSLVPITVRWELFHLFLHCKRSLSLVFLSWFLSTF